MPGTTYLLTKRKVMMNYGTEKYQQGLSDTMYHIILPRFRSEVEYYQYDRVGYVHDFVKYINTLFDEQHMPNNWYKIHVDTIDKLINITPQTLYGYMFLLFNDLHANYTYYHASNDNK